ncbi:MAG: 50S ribosomal protein L4, partial [Microgenomates group bacterium GW2011_GWC1_39_7]
KAIFKKVVAKSTVKKTSVLKPKVARSSRLVADVYNIQGKIVSKIGLPKEVFGAKVNRVLMAQAVRVHLANQRQGTASTKTRGQVTGSTRKIYRQKGTGRARHGSIKAPIFVGGGIVFGPSPRDFSLKLSKQMRRKALFSALSQKFVNERILVVDVNGASGKTKEIYQMFKSLNLLGKKGKVGKILFVSGANALTKQAAKNIEGVKIEPAKSINTYDVLSNNHLVIVKNALADIESTFLGKGENKSST